MYAVTGQSSSGVDIVALIVALAIIGILICLSMPICILCLIIALCCTCRKYRKAKRPSELDAEETRQENKPSIHNLPLPPIPPEDATMQGSEAYEALTLRDNMVYGMNNQGMQGNDAYGINSLSMTLEANQAYDLKVSTDQRDATHIPHMNEITDKTEEDYLKLLSPDQQKSNEDTIPTQPAISNPPTDGHQDDLGDGQLVERSDYYNYYDYI